MPLDDRKILVVGGTGFLGRPVAQMLDFFGFPIRIFTHSPAKAKDMYGKHYDIAVGDIADPASIERAMDGCYGVHINLSGGPKPDDYGRIEYLGTKAIVEAAKKLNVKRLTYISGASVSADRLWFPPTRAKYMAEQEIINSGLEYAIFRATWFMESLPLFVRDGKAIIMGRQPEKIHWIAAKDYARMASRVYMMDEPVKKIFMVFGPDAYTFADAFEMYREVIDPAINIIQTPIGVLRLSALLTRNARLKDIVSLMKYFRKHGELGDPIEADEMLGRPSITLYNWLENYKNITSRADVKI